MMDHWDIFFLKQVAVTYASKSKDRSTQVGAVITSGDDHAVLSTGWNGFPRGVNDDVEERHLRPDKYIWTEHAERNGIYNAARRGIPLLGSTLYSTLMPCCDCARAAIQSGIVRVVTNEPDWSDQHRNDASKHHQSLEMFREAGVEVVFADPDQKETDG